MDIGTTAVVCVVAAIACTICIVAVLDATARKIVVGWYTVRIGRARPSGRGAPIQRPGSLPADEGGVEHIPRHGERESLLRVQRRLGLALTPRGLSAAAAALRNGGSPGPGDAARRQDHLTQRLWDTLSQAIPELHPTGPSTDRLPNTLNLCFPGVSGAELLSCTPQIAASTAGACHDGRETHSAVLAAMGIPASIARGAIRLSVGRTTTADEVDAAAAALITSWRTLQAR